MQGGSAQPKQCDDPIAPLENPPFVFILIAERNKFIVPLTLLAQANMQDMQPIQRDIYFETKTLLIL
jgi:hypothetical protein